MVNIKRLRYCTAVMLAALALILLGQPVTAADDIEVAFSKTQETSEGVVFRVTATNATVSGTRLLPVAVSATEHGLYGLSVESIVVELVVIDELAELKTPAPPSVLFPGLNDDLYGQGDGVAVFEVTIDVNLVNIDDVWCSSGLLTVTIGATDYSDEATSSWAFIDEEAGLPAAPGDLGAEASGNNINLSWAKGNKADTTIVVRGTNGYPEDINDGMLIYSGGGAAAVDAGATNEADTLYYRAWSLNNCGYSEDYGQAKAGGTMVEVIILGGIVAWAVAKKDTFVYIIAGVSVLLYSYGLIDPGISENLVYKTSPLMLLGLYMIIRAGMYQFMKNRE